MKNKKIFGASLLVLFGIILGAVLVSGFGLVRPGWADINLGADSPPVNLDADANSFSKAFIQVAENVTPTIVHISVVAERKGGGNDFFFFPFKEFESPNESRGSGSGFIIREDGYILTNNHVIDGASKITVNLYDKRTFTATVIGTDPLTDLAVIKIDADNLPVAFLGDSDNLKVGQWVMAIGNPLSLTSTVTAGIVSAIGRGQLGLINDSYGVENFIQTDAAINPGNSGGALVDLSGAVIGVNTAIATKTGSYIGYGFAIPINLAESVAKDLISHGKVTRGYIGINISEVDDAIAKSLGMDKPRGIIIQGILPDGAASKEDIKEGDVILKVDGREVNQPNDLQSYIASKSAGTTVKLLLYRNGKEIERSITLKAREEDTKNQPVSNNKEKEKKDNSESSSAEFAEIGLTVKNLSSKEKETFKIENGVIITGVKPFSKAEDQRLSRNLVITEVDRQKVNNVTEFENIINNKKGNAVLLKVQDAQGNSRFIGLEIPS